MPGVKSLRRIQLSNEATKGLAVPATTYWRGLGTIQDTLEVVHPEEDVGILGGIDRAYIPKLGAELEMEDTEATFEQLPYILEAGIASQSPAQDGAGTLYIYTYTIPTTTQGTWRTYTIEAGDDHAAEEIEYGFVEEFTLSGNEFWYYRSWPRIYCSQKCSAAVNAKANLGIVDNPPVEVICDNCETVFLKAPDQIAVTKHNFCNHKCFGEYLSRTQKGIPRPEVTGEKPHLQKRVTKTCPQCLAEFRVKQSHADRRVFCKKACQVEWQRLNNALVSGENNFNWRGGYEPYYGPNWRKQRRLARQRDNFTCRRCGITETESRRKLDVHHLIAFREYGIERCKEANHLGNLISYCNVCHLIVEHEAGARPSISPASLGLYGPLRPLFPPAHTAPF